MIVLSCNKIHKSFGIDVILKDITFSINEGEKIGLIGANGAGKSTLFKILTSQMEYDSGELFIDKSKKVGYLSQNLSLESDNTIYGELLLVFEELLNMERKMKTLEEKMNEPYDEAKADYHNKLIKDYTTLTELYQHRGGYTYKGEISRVLKGLGFFEGDFEKSINILSGGQKTRVALCKLLLRKPEILLLDEPTNHLDLDAIEWLEEYLKSYKGSIVIISHDRFFLDAVTNKTIEISHGMAEIYNGNYTAFIDLKKKNYEVALKAFSLQQAEIKRQEEIIQKYKSFNREKSIKAAESRQKALDKIERIEAPHKDQKASRINFETKIKSGNDILYVEELSKSYGEKVLFTGVNVDIKRENKIALIGENGRGKTTLFKIIMDEIQPNSGTKVLGKNVNIGYYDQEQSNLELNKTIIDEVWDDFPELTTTEIRTYLAAFLFRGDDVFKKIEKLSGGEKCRINLLKLMLSQNNFLLLDEPTNHLDIVSREALEDAILSYDGTVLVISHDRYFLNKVVDKIFELNEDGIKEYLGNYSYYIEKKNNPLRFEQEEQGSGITKTQMKLDKKKKREEEKKQREVQKYLKNLEEKIATTESEIEKLQELLCKEEVYSNPEKSVEVNELLGQKEELLSNLYEEWEENL
ncbi:ribosomal protection-like ABC-F family protein [Clostridium senegalense]|uniref:ABC-F family ATP-binding cassette domain-containing protein n=1 Tax=Clostridium senegalense TaxID=1465809 RepID=A0A6M0H4B9_9CLOT|nr:ABC-F family ATP-binding cassette domain-containing protein [Clostridium senegalense]NEU05545.1 ABC-F family ATP-binding cassette domain-containing protein [Clostridium senegalense]